MGMEGRERGERREELGASGRLISASCSVEETESTAPRQEQTPQPGVMGEPSAGGRGPWEGERALGGRGGQQGALCIDELELQQ